MSGDVESNDITEGRPMHVIVGGRVQPIIKVANFLFELF